MLIADLKLQIHNLLQHYKMGRLVGCLLGAVLVGGKRSLGASVTATDEGTNWEHEILHINDCGTIFPYSGIFQKKIWGVGGEREKRVQNINLK